MARALEQPPKFLPSEWKHSNEMHFRRAEAERSCSNRLTAECSRLIEDSEKSTKRLQQDANKSLEQRIKEIKFWRQELDQKIQDIGEEIELLLALKARVERALESCYEPLEAVLSCLNERQKRVAIDLVNDKVEQELLKEKEVIEDVMSLLQQTLEQIIEQIRLNHSAKYYLEKDLRDKFQAEHIDDFCSVLTTAAVRNEIQSGLPQLVKGGLAVSVKEWETFSNHNICNADKERNKSASLRALVNNLLEQTSADMRRQHEATCMALKQRIEETRKAKTQLEEQQQRVLDEIASQEKNMEALKVAIANKEGPLKLAQARLHARSQRPNIELCYDPVHACLVSEVQELTGLVLRLKEGLYNSEMELRALTQNQLQLEEDIRVKSNSLYIDEVRCGQLLQPIVIRNF